MPSETQQLDEKETWDLTTLYQSEEVWQRARAAFEEKIGGVGAHRGHLGESSERLLAALNLVSDLHREYQRLASYAHMKSDLDRRDSAALARAQQIDLTGTKLAARTSFLAPEILSVPEERIAQFLAKEPGLLAFAHDIDDMLRRRRHTLTPAEETLLADAGVMASAPEDVYGVFTNAELPWPELTLASAEKIHLDQSTFVRLRSSSDRDDRLAVFRSFFGAWQGYAGTCGVLLDAEVKKNIFYARARRYGSAVEAALDRNHVPVSVYDAVLASANEGLHSLHRYTALRARVLGVSVLGYHDTYASLVPASSRGYTIDEAKNLVLAALSPLGDDYLSVLRKGYDNRWIDFHPVRGKRSGAYSNGSIYGGHPFILMNYSGHFDAVLTLAHESGHAMHSYLANAAQPYPTADYSIFVAEVASTFNEALVYRYAIDHATDDGERLSLLASYLDGLRGTFFRQAMFAEFERLVYASAENGDGLTGESLSAMYRALLRKYLGAAKGVCAIDDLYGIEWAYIPHFYANFYVYQYATGYAASTALAHRVLSGDPTVAASYLKFLEAGGSDYPYELLKHAGVDMATAEPYKATIAELDRVMDEIERMLAVSR